MKNLREIAGNIVVIGGLLTSGISAVDAAINTGLRQRVALEEQLEDIYGVNRECHSSGMPYAVLCNTQVVTGNYSEDEKVAIIDAFYKDLEEGDRVIYQDPDNKARASRDVVGMVAGLGIAGAGNVIRPKKSE